MPHSKSDDRASQKGVFWQGSFLTTLFLETMKFQAKLEGTTGPRYLFSGRMNNGARSDMAVPVLAQRLGAVKPMDRTMFDLISLATPTNSSIR